MRKLVLLFAILLVCAPAGFAQSDYSNWNFLLATLTSVPTMVPIAWIVEEGHKQ